MPARTDGVEVNRTQRGRTLGERHYKAEWRKGQDGRRAGGFGPGQLAGFSSSSGGAWERSCTEWQSKHSFCLELDVLAPEFTWKTNKQK